ncbi:toll/interleukin-1 receptor domain-containing protein [Serratia marcescens]|uniref:TIR domain-containing protein n=1 Tax=Serratia marcescens TaxID=615 RepID=UPI001F070891|nr:TIR domain-containing protein [Serratia marcescens]EIJ7464729.1 toll/interleukin-1 receptor domain-containing protein [Serratia marcescens]EJA2553031.1 toll/interleukin-1 receptor domain-containing protein [Serratia marcescens]EJA2597410.1 toll/interleukin-1 receptor domain-containing protein [Serratia marcescens]UMK45831.1 toll/interleukin-1 receptor domain-containing protein [Serratia marcescens]
MNVFISWSGVLSKKIAITVRDWLPNVIQCVEPYVSSEDIDKGSRWHMDISKQLDSTSYGIICLTKENIAAPWINFEAGALGKSVDNSRVCPLLFDLMPSDIQGPISGFQTTKADDKDDFYKLISSINKTSPTPIKEERLDEIFDVWWPRLESKLKTLLEEQEKEEPKEKPRSRTQQTALLNDKTSMILEELLDMSRSNFKLLRDPESILPAGYVQSVMKGVDPEAERTMMAVYRDLQNAFDMLSAMASNDESLADIVRSFDDPIRYIRRTYGRPRSRIRRSIFGDEGS